MREVSVHEVKAHFSAIMKDVEAGEVVIVTRHDKPIMEMRSVAGLVVPQLGTFAQPDGTHLEVNWTDAEIDELFGDSDTPFGASS